MLDLAVPGTDVFAPWGDGYLYVAVVVERDPDDDTEVLVAYWEGEAATVAIKDLRPFAIDVGMKVFANHLNENDYQAGTIRQRIGGAIQVTLKNGSTIWTTWAKIRIKKK
jgi:hypothetical protein